MLWFHLFSDTISPHQKKLQEAKFEIIKSEASYINSLNVLEKHFMSSLEKCDESVLSKNDRQILFSNLIPGNPTHGITSH
jgi:neuronal guanine nucleotide exchange factor